MFKMEITTTEYYLTLQDRKLVYEPCSNKIKKHDPWPEMIFNEI